MLHNAAERINEPARARDTFLTADIQQMIMYNMALEKRTQIYLAGQQHGALKRIAHQRGVSLAQIVREALTAYMAAETQPAWHRATGSMDPLGDLIGCAEGDGDLAAHHDDYLYGKARRRRAK